MPDKEWTLMFYFACDNDLTPSVVTQLKALKQAGFHPDVNVVAHFDPQAEDTPTHVFDVNLVNKLKSPGESKIGFRPNDPFVRTLMEDKLWGEQLTRDGKKIRKQLPAALERQGALHYDPPEPPADKVVNATKPPEVPGMPRTDQSIEPRLREMGPRQSLATFLEFCADHYKAKHYMLFILGHGVVVGNDIFLFDEHVDSDEHSLSLIGLGEVLNTFAEKITKQGSEFELISFHSCSVSSLEVTHQLQSDQEGKPRGTANYMLASQGPSFVGSWPYREILIRVFNDVDDLQKLDDDKNKQRKAIKEMVGKIFQYVLYNSSDFLLAGYSFGLTLCDLNKASEVTPKLKQLSEALIKGLPDARVRNLILLAHGKTISFWGESYTDLFDFCLCLIGLGEEYNGGPGETNPLVSTIVTACSDVLEQLAPGSEGNDDKFIVRTDFAGPSYQYSHGLSVFFPWAPPPRRFMFAYKQYKYAAATSWNEFLIGNEFRDGNEILGGYFKATRRKPRKDEDPPAPQRPGKAAKVKIQDDELAEDIASICFNNEGPLNTGAVSDQLAGPKPDPRDLTGDGCNCGTIKNYPRDTRSQRARARAADEEGPLPLGDQGFTLF